MLKLIICLLELTLMNDSQFAYILMIKVQGSDVTILYLTICAMRFLTSYQVLYPQPPAAGLCWCHQVDYTHTHKAGEGRWRLCRGRAGELVL